MQNPTQAALRARLNQLYQDYTQLRLQNNPPTPTQIISYTQLRQEVIALFEPALLAPPSPNKKEAFGRLLAAYEALLKLEKKCPALVKIFAQAADTQKIQQIRQHINNKIAELRASQAAKFKPKTSTSRNI